MALSPCEGPQAQNAKRISGAIYSLTVNTKQGKDPKEKEGEEDDDVDDNDEDDDDVGDEEKEDEKKEDEEKSGGRKRERCPLVRSPRQPLQVSQILNNAKH